MTLTVKDSLRQIFCKTPIYISTDLSYLRNAMSPELQGHQIPMAKVSFGSLGVNAYYAVLLGYWSVLGSVLESRLALAWLITVDLKSQERLDLEGWQPPLLCWEGRFLWQEALGRLKRLAREVSLLSSPKRFSVKKQESTLSHSSLHHTAFCSMELGFIFFSQTSADLASKVNCGKWVLYIFLCKLKVYLLQKIPCSCPCFFLVLQTHI